MLASIKGTITKRLNALEQLGVEADSLLQKNEIESKSVLEQMQAVMNKLELTLNGLRDFDQSIVTSVSTLGANSRDQAMDSVYQHKENRNYEDVILRANAKLAELAARRESCRTSTENSSHDISARDLERSLRSTTEARVNRPKLPKLVIPKFEGDITLFEEFWSIFTHAVHSNEDMAEVEKLIMLKSLLVGDASVILRSLPVKPEMYSVAYDLVAKRYTNAISNRASVMKKLQQIEVAQRTPSSLRRTQDSLRAYLATISVYEAHSAKSSMTVEMFKQKFPETVRTKLTKRERKARDPWTAKELFEALDEIIEEEEAVSVSIDQRSMSSSYFGRVEDEAGVVDSFHLSNQSHRVGRSRRMSREDRNRNTGIKDGKPCVYCGKDNHESHKCFKYRYVEDRRQYMIDNNRCFKCAAVFHPDKQCRDRCKFCDSERHHSSLCYRQNESKRSLTRDRSRDGSRSRERSSSPVSSKVEMRRPYKRDPTPHNAVSFASASYEIPSRSVQSLMSNSVSSVSLMTVVARIFSRVSNKFEPITILLDSGSQTSFITESMCDRLGLESEREVVLQVRGIAGCKSTSRSKVVKPVLKTLDGAEHRVQVYTQEVITKGFPSCRLSAEDLDTLQGSFSKADSFLRSVPMSDNELVCPDMLIGIDLFWDFMCAETKPVLLPSGLRAIMSKFGLTISGVAGSKTAVAHASEIVEFDACDAYKVEVNEEITKFWDLEIIGITDDPTVESDRAVNAKVIEHFNETVVVKGSKISVSFPYNGKQSSLRDNYPVALKRLESQFRSLKDKPELWKSYCKIIDDQVEAQIIEAVPDKDYRTGEVVYYLPHQSVVKPDSNTTKLRIVYDASSHMKGSCSLNDCMYPGPTILPNLLGVLIRSRTYPILTICDVEKAFHMIHLQESVRDAVRFLWLKDTSAPPNPDNISVMRFCRVPFGVTASPFLLAMSIVYFLSNSSSFLSEEVVRNMYVDNVVYGAGSKEEAMTKYTESKSLFRNMGMNLREYVSSESEVSELIAEKDRAVSKEIVKLLGILWSPKADTYSVKPPLGMSASITKRNILRHTASMFDPLGWMIPVTVRSRLFIRDLWMKGYAWDQELREEDLELWKLFSGDMRDIACNIPRRMLVDEDSEIQLVVFSDASTFAYAACVYLVAKSRNQITSHLVMAKSRVVPNKPITIPRLELLAILIGVRLLCFVKSQLDVTITKAHIMSDSQISLFWLHSNRKLKMFVQNKVDSIRKMARSLNESQISTTFHYVPTDQNPADCASRGISSAELVEHMSWNGPGWLTAEATAWPTKTEGFQLPEHTSNPELILEDVISMSVLSEEFQSVLPFSRTNSLDKLCRIVAYVMRFIFRTKGKKSLLNIQFIDIFSRRQRYITESERLSAEKLLVLHHYKESRLQLQLSKVMLDLDPRMDQDGMLRCHGRMQKSELPGEAITPILIAPSHSLARLIILRTHRTLKHVGVQHTLSQIRMKYWIPQGRRTVQAVLRGCVVCNRVNSHPLKYPRMPALPAERVSKSRPFANIGLDYFGPVMCKDNDGNTVKIWCMLVSCMVTRAVHLEVVMNNGVEEFILAVRRFIARRGLPHSVVSDNAPTFKLGFELVNNDLVSNFQLSVVEERFNRLGIEWKFITPLSPWKGGFYERFVMSVKQCLRKVLRNEKLKIRQFETVLIEVENIVNSRPLTYAATSISDTVPLRPVDFLIPGVHVLERNSAKEDDRSDTDFSPGVTIVSRQQALSLIESCNSALDNFWQIWHDFYLTGLRETHIVSMDSKKFGSKRVPAKGEVVIVRDGILPRGQWPLGLVTEVHCSGDGYIRSVSVRFATGRTLERSVNHLYPLEVSAAESVSEENQDDKTLRRSSRERRSVERLGIC